MRHAVALRVLASLALTLALGPATARAQGTLVVQNSTEPPGLDLTATPASATAGVVLYNIQECLVKVDRHGKLVPWLAERWNTTDNRNYTFFLKRGVRFHNGRELRAADVKYVFDRAMNPETKHPYPGYYTAIGDIIVGDDYTITFALKSLNANFLLNLARQGSVIYPREAVDTLKSEPIGTGPFRFAEWVRGDRIVLALSTTRRASRSSTRSCSGSSRTPTPRWRRSRPATSTPRSSASGRSTRRSCRRTRASR